MITLGRIFFGIFVVCCVVGCSNEIDDFEACDLYPVKDTRGLIAEEFKSLVYRKMTPYEAIRNESQLFLANSKFDYSTSYVLGFAHQVGLSNINQHSVGCLDSSSLSIKLPMDDAGHQMFRLYIARLGNAGFSGKALLAVDESLSQGTPYSGVERTGEYTLFAGVSEHSVRGRYFKIDVRK